jgi:tripartite-type tricarboxylate transporter receptor subunit TctC
LGEEVSHAPGQAHAELARRAVDHDLAVEVADGVVSTSPYGLAGPKGMDPAVVRKLHDAFKKAMDDPRHIEVLKQLNQDAWYRSGADYAQWVREAYAKDKVLIDRLGLAAK